MQKRRWQFLFGAVALVAVLVAGFYWRTTAFDFVDFDDTEYVTANPHVTGGLSVENAVWAMRPGYAANWHPLTWLSLQADATVAPAGRLASVMHGHNALLHGLNAALLLLLMLTMQEGMRRGVGPGPAVLSVALTLIWALHPLRAEAVCWVSERKELLCVLFMLLTMIAYAKGVVGSRSRTAVLSFLFFICALLAKPVAVTLPAVIFAWSWIFGGRDFRRSFLRALPFGLVACGCVAMTVLAQRGAIGDAAGAALGVRILNALASYGVYAVQTVWPADLAPMYIWSSAVPAGPVALGAAFLVAAAAVCVLAYRGRGGDAVGALAFGAVWVVIGLLPMVGLVQVGSQAHADRYTYWVGAGAAVAACLALRPLAGRRWTGWILLALAAVVAVPGWMQVGHWRNNLAMYAHAWEVTRNGWSAVGLGKEKMRLGRPDEAGRLFREAVKANPAAESFAQLALYLATKAGAYPQDLVEAMDLGRRAAALDRTAAVPHEAMGIASGRMGDLPRAVEELEEAVRLGSDTPVIVESLKRARRILDARR